MRVRVRGGPRALVGLGRVRRGLARHAALGQGGAGAARGGHSRGGERAAARGQRGVLGDGGRVAGHLALVRRGDARLGGQLADGRRLVALGAVGDLGDVASQLVAQQLREVAQVRRPVPRLVRG